MYESDWYLLDRGGQRYGPYERDFIEQLVAQHEVLQDTRVWHPGLPHWRRADQVLKFAPLARVLGSAGSQSNAVQVRATPSAHMKAAEAPRAVPQASTVATAAAVRAKLEAEVRRRAAAAKTGVLVFSPTHVWQRVLAGLFDLLLLGAGLQALATFVLTGAPWLTSGKVLLVAWAAADAWLLANVGTTPGKALLAVTIRGKGGGKLEPKRALLHSGALPLALLLLDTFGWVFGLPALVLLAIAWQRLRSGRGLWWDELADGTVEYGELTSARRVVAVVGFAALLLVIALLRNLSQDFAQRWT